MYLARGVLNPASRDVQRDLADPAQLHRSVMRLFPEQSGVDPRATLQVLHRVDEDARRHELVLFVQSALAPDFSKLSGGYLLDVGRDATEELDNPQLRSVEGERRAIREGERFGFRLRANTTRKILTRSLPDGTKQNGKRVPVRGDAERLKWLMRHAAEGGFGVLDVRVAETHAWRSRVKPGLALAGAQFDGILVVNHAEAFRSTLTRGIGPAKAFGFGLLSIQRVDA